MATEEQKKLARYKTIITNLRREISTTLRKANDADHRSKVEQRDRYLTEVANMKAEIGRYQKLMDES